MQVRYDRITTTIEREWLSQIIAGTKKIEYRRIKPYWTKRFNRVSVPFELRLLNGMNRPVPEVTVLIHKITKDRRAGEYRLHIKKVLGFNRMFARSYAEKMVAALRLRKMQHEQQSQSAAPGAEEPSPANLAGRTERQNRESAADRQPRPASAEPHPGGATPDHGDGN